MNKNILKISTLVAIWAFCSQNATAQQGFGTNQPSKASAIEMTSSSKGLLIPRVALTELNDFDPIKGELGTDAAKVNSLLVYNTATTTGITPGYYYWTTDGTTPNSYWKRLLAGDDAAALNLLGDVTGTLGATTVVKIQGHDVAITAPTSNQVLTWNGTAWTPTSLTPTQITNKATLSLQDGLAITAGSGTDALLGAATIGISNGGIAPVKIQPAAEPRTTRMVMVTQTDGTVTWIPQTDIAPTTTNALTSVVNSMTSNVNGVSSSANIINTNGLSVAGTELTSTVNGVPATVDLASVVQAGETLTSITQDVTSGVITYKRERDADQTANVVRATSDNLISYNAGAFLNATTIQNNQLNTVVAQGTGITVTPSTSGNTTTYTVAANPVDAADLTNKGTLSVSGGLEFTGSSNGTDKLLANAGIGVANGGIDNVKLADNAVTTVKILDKNVTPAKIEGGTEGQVLTTNTAGEATWVTPTDNNTITTVKADAAQSYVSVTSNPVTPGETANREYTVGVNAATAQVGTTAGTAGVVKPGHQFEIETDGHLSVKYAMPQFFYMPSVLINTSAATGSVNLYTTYTTQFGSPLVSSGSAEAGGIPTLSVKDLDFYVTYYDTNVISNIQIDANGNMTYNVIGAPTNLSFVNVVFKVRTTPKP